MTEKEPQPNTKQRTKRGPVERFVVKLLFDGYQDELRKQRRQEKKQYEQSPAGRVERARTAEEERNKTIVESKLEDPVLRRQFNQQFPLLATQELQQQAVMIDEAPQDFKVRGLFGGWRYHRQLRKGRESIMAMDALLDSVAVPDSFAEGVKKLHGGRERGIEAARLELARQTESTELEPALPPETPPELLLLEPQSSDQLLPQSDSVQLPVHPLASSE